MWAFASGNLALDFTWTVRARTTYARDQLPDPAALADWLVAAGVLDTVSTCGATELARAKAVREAAYRMALALTRGEPFDAADLALVNRTARGALPGVRLHPDATMVRTGDVDAALAAIARAAVELLGGPDRDRIKKCEREDCTRLYVDTSRARSRRWCDMTVCGNRAKSAAFRARRGTPPD
ncbi:ABATE domain-containing protein [Nocardia terpenica]|uniref:CGNR zinc finger domain-containing protein n=1 Tax=Nocardia terpenica TaxID=455432 RepID=UPI001894A529|nr:ABATE domain-containing protein [Nocardia terpenica]MBF6062942.1 ABATE domain-containing protein [Nocardia terpenica]MBF6104923.1 ABATE domain-containing protein [Nocardia terpenica]MBF6112640.1 ABATE domain-containing protein [Nocardia terpenica]MBF6118651.1 ABATE domain-containing protein [Nocardia terpenica]MBF6155130.1 ABATE domain-containing protein [Nocardia terpenica]